MQDERLLRNEEWVDLTEVESRFDQERFFEPLEPEKRVRGSTEEAADLDRFLDDDTRKIARTLSDGAEWLLTINGNPFRFKGRDYLKRVYDVDSDYGHASRNVVIVSGRQVEKSTTLCGKNIVLGAMIPNFQTLFIQPRFDQVKVFSQQRFGPMAEDSEKLKRFWLSNKRVWQVTAREFLNRSFFNFRSCYYSADPLRGITAHSINIDELQDIISDNIPVIEECQSHFLYEEPEKCFRTYSGTPKTTSNTLSLQYNQTCQFEWMVRCDACHHWNYLDDKVIGKHHYICTRCGKQIHMQNGEWCAAKPSLAEERWGYRIPQLMVPFMSHRDILRKMENPNISKMTFFNEVLGLAFDEGELVLTRDDILSRCEPRPADTPEAAKKRGVAIFAGIDHGTGQAGSVDPRTGMRSMKRKSNPPSFTVVAILADCPDGVMRVLKIIRFVGDMTNLAEQPRLIDEIVRKYGVSWAMSDWGFGAQTNQSLVTHFSWARMDNGVDPLLMEAQYVRSKNLASFHPRSFRYMIDRNFAIEQAVDAIKKGLIRFFRQQEMEDYIDDFTSMYREYDFNLNRIKYDHTLPDDCFQAVVYAYLAARQRRGNLVPSFTPNI